MDKVISDKKKFWYYAAAVSLAISILSAFTSIISYKFYGLKCSYNIVDLLEGDEFTETVLASYNGPVYWNMGTLEVSVLSVISILSLLLAFIGLITLRQQRPNLWQFRMTTIGLIGTAVPALIILAGVFYFKDYFPGKIMCGIYPILSPLATLVSVVAVHRKKNLVQEEIRKELEYSRIMWRASEHDLE